MDWLTHLLKRIFRDKVDIIVICSILAAYLVATVYVYENLVDDTFISLRYAENLVHYGQLSYNPGEAPEEGFSNLLLVLIEAFFIKTGMLVPVNIPRVIGIISGLLTILVVFGISQTVIDWKNKCFKYLPCVAIATSTPFIVWATGGLETLLFTFLVTAGAWAFIYSLQPGKVKYSWYYDVLLFLAALCRPEGIMFWGLGYFYLALNYKRVEIRGRLKSTLILFGLFTAYLVWKLYYFGDLLPLTFYAKQVQYSLGIIEGGLKRLFIFQLINLNFIYFVFIVVLLIITRKKKSHVTRYFLLVLVVYILYVAMHGFRIAMDRTFRFYVPVLPLFYILGSMGIASVFAESRFRWLQKSAVYIFSVLMMLQILVGASDLNYAWNKDGSFGTYVAKLGLKDQAWQLRNGYVRAGQWLREAIPPGSTIVMIDVGAVPYYSKLNVIDVWSLVTKDLVLLRRQRSKFSIGTPGYEAINKQIRDYVFGRSPEVILQLGQDKKFLGEDYGFVNDDRFYNNYIDTNRFFKYFDYKLHVFVRKDL